MAEPVGPFAGAVPRSNADDQPQVINEVPPVQVIRAAGELDERISMLSKLRALLVGTLAITGMLVVSAPAAQAATYTAVAQTNAYGRTLILWQWSDGNRRCYHAEGKNLLSNEVVAVVKNNSDILTATSPRDGSTVNTGSLCGVGSMYHAALDMRAPDLFVYAGPWTE